MIDITKVRCPRSSYPNHRQNKFDYSNDGNIDAYLNTAAKLGINPSIVKNDRLPITEIQHLIDKIVDSKSIHEITVYSDILWDAYNSYDDAIELIGQRMLLEKPKAQQQLVLLIKYLRMDNGLNRRSIEGKHYNDIMEDAYYFKKVAERANFFLNKIAKAK